MYLLCVFFSMINLLQVVIYMICFEMLLFEKKYDRLRHYMITFCTDFILYGYCYIYEIKFKKICKKKYVYLIQLYCSTIYVFVSKILINCYKLDSQKEHSRSWINCCFKGFTFPNNLMSNNIHKPCLWHFECVSPGSTGSA